MKKFKDQRGWAEGLPFYKGNLHSHTTNSDGCLSPQESVRLFKAHGYSFLCLSEHDRYTDYRPDFDTGDFIILPGLEASAILREKPGSQNRIRVHHMQGILGTEAMQAAAPKHLAHLEVLPPPVYFESWDGAAVAQQLCETLQSCGCLVTYNHPVWSRVLPQEFLELEGAFALEIYNYNTVNESGTGADTTYWDLMLRAGKHINGFASDDNHNEGKFDDACGGWVMVGAPALTHDAITGALAAGCYYSSSGPQITGWGVRGDRVWVDCSPCARVNFIAGGFLNAGATVIAPAGTTLYHAETALRGDETYLRVECIDANGKTAWTNPLFLAGAE